MQSGEEIKNFDDTKEVGELNRIVDLTLNACKQTLRQISKVEKKFKNISDEIRKNEQMLKRLAYQFRTSPDTLTVLTSTGYEAVYKEYLNSKAELSNYEREMKGLNLSFKMEVAELRRLEGHYGKEYEWHLKNSLLTPEDKPTICSRMKYLQQFREVNEALVSFSEDILNGKYKGYNPTFGVKQDLLQKVENLIDKHKNIGGLAKFKSSPERLFDDMLKDLNVLKSAKRKQSNILFSAEENINKALTRIAERKAKVPKTKLELMLLREDPDNKREKKELGKKKADIALSFIIAKAFDKSSPINNNDAIMALIQFASDDNNIKLLTKKLDEHLSKINISSKEKDKMKKILQNEIKALSEVAEAMYWGQPEVREENLRKINKNYSTSKVKNTVIESMKLYILENTLTTQKNSIVKEQACEFVLRTILRKEIPNKFKVFDAAEKATLLKSISKNDLQAYVIKILGKNALTLLNSEIQALFFCDDDRIETEKMPDRVIELITGESDASENFLNEVRENIDLNSDDLNPEDFEMKIQNSLAQKTLISDTKLESINYGEVLNLTERILTNVTNSYTKSDAKKLQQALKTYKQYKVEVLDGVLSKNKWSNFKSGGESDWMTFGDRSIKTRFVNAMKLIAQTVHTAKHQNGKSNTVDIVEFNKVCDELIKIDNQEDFYDCLKKNNVRSLFEEIFVDALEREANERVSEIGKEQAKDIVSLVVNSLLFLLTTFLTVIGVNSLLTPTTSVTGGLTTTTNPDIITALGTPIPPAPTINSSLLGISKDMASKVAIPGSSSMSGLTNRQSNQSNHEARIESKNDAISEASKEALMKMVNSRIENEKMETSDIKVKPNKEIKLCEDRRVP